MSAFDSQFRAIFAGDRGTSSAEFLVGAGVGLVVAAAALALTVGLVLESTEQSIHAERRIAAAWALEVMAQDIRRSGLGVPPGGKAGAVDEGVEFFDRAAFALRSDFDAVDRKQAREPEVELLDASVSAAPTGNDEVVFFLRRRPDGGGSRDARFEADLDSEDRVLLDDGTLLARRDGVVDEASAGPFLDTGERIEGTLYRVHFSHDANDFGGGRFRVSIPLIDHVLDLRFQAFDEEGEPVDPCGGTDDADSRACRSSIRKVSIRLEAAVPGRRALVLEREISFGKP